MRKHEERYSLENRKVSVVKAIKSEVELQIGQKNNIIYKQNSKREQNYVNHGDGKDRRKRKWERIKQINRKHCRE